MGKKKKEIMEKEKKKFVAGCVQNGYPKKVAQDIYAFIEKFAAYGFNKAHAASYAVISYWTAYMKANYPVEFMTALLTAELQGAAGPIREQKMAQAMDECRRMNIKVLIPDINKSYYSFTIEGESIRFGMSAIKNVGAAAIESIIEARKTKPFTGLKDLLKRVDLRKVNKKTIESLIHAGALDAFGNRATLLHYYPVLVKEIAEKKESHEKGQFGLFHDEAAEEKVEDNFIPIEEMDADQKLFLEKEVVGFFLNYNPLTKYTDIINKKVTKKLGHITHEDNNHTHILAGVVSMKKIIKTKKDNHEMAFLNIYDETGSIEVVVFPKTYQKLKDILETNNVLIMKGKINDKEGTMCILVDNAVRLDQKAISS
jgi:DNA polymerase-3 subunit alpha